MATQQNHPASNLWTSATDSQPEGPLVVQDGNWHHLGPAAGSPFRSPGVCLQKSWIDDDRWKLQKCLEWGGGAGVMGGVAERGKEGSWTGAQERQQSPFELDSIFRRSPVQEEMFTWSPGSRLSPPAEVTPRGRSSGGGSTVSASYGSKFWAGRERKRCNVDQDEDGCEFVVKSQQ